MAKRPQGPEIIELREHYWPLMQNTRTAATRARDMIAGKLGVTLPETVKLAGADAWLGDLPHKRTVPQRARQKLIAKQWEIKRPQASAGPRAASVASKIEQPLQAIMKDRRGAGFPWADVNDLLLIEGLAFSTALIDPANWQRGPTLYGPDGKSLKSEYRYDAKGRHESDEGYEGSDLSTSRREQQRDRDDYMARHLPFRQRAYSIRSCAPIWDGYGNLEGLIVETHWSAHTLKARGFVASNDKDGTHLYPLGALGEGDSATHGEQIKVTELYWCDEDGPYISYCIDGKYTWKQKDDKLEPHVIDLSKIGPPGNLKGLSRLPISWGWGLGWSMADLDERAMSFIAPYLQSWRNVDSLITAAITWSQHRAFPILMEQNESGIPDADDLNLEDDLPAPQTLLPMTLNRVKGKVTELGTQGISKDVYQLVGLMLGENKAETPAGGEEGGSSGIAMSMAEAFESDALATIADSARRMCSDAASFVLEGAKVIGEAWEPVRVYESADVLLAQTQPSDKSKPMVLEPGLVGSNFDVEAIAKKVRGENPAVRQQNAGLVEAGLMSKETFLEEDGYQAPEAEVAKINYEQIMASEPGQATTLRLLEQYVSDLFIEQLLKKINGGQANQAGLPVGYAQELAGPPPDMIQSTGSLDGGQMPGLSVPDPAMSSMMGAVAGGLGTGPMNAIGRAGGEIPQTPMQMAPGG